MKPPDSDYPRVLMFGYQGCGNLGDELMAAAVIQQFRRVVPNAEFHLRSWTQSEEVDGVYYTGIEEILSGSQPRWLRLLRYLGRLFAEVSWCDLIVFPGGTVFHSESSKPWSLRIAFALTVLARFRRRPVIACGVGVAEIRGRTPRFLMKYIVSTSRRFIVRDRRSYRRVSALARKAEVDLTPDIAFAVEADLPATGFPPSAVSVSLSSVHMGAILEHRDSLSAALESLSRRACSSSAGRSGRMNFLLMSDPPSAACGLSDAVCLDALFGSLDAAPARVVGQQDVMAAISASEVVVGARYHSLVLAALLGVPFVALGDDDKLRAIAESFDMPRLDFIDVTPCSLVSAIEDAKRRGIDEGIRLEAILEARACLNSLAKDFP
jgi:polysaccharide pyruvyl transferase WcaK-like protein